MNIAKKLTGVGVLVLFVSTGVFDLANGNKIFKASISLFDNPAIKWGAIATGAISIIGGALYLLVNKNALKRKVIEYGEVGFVVVNGNPKRYRWGKWKGTLVIRTEGQGKNVIPRLRDVVTISWLPDPMEVESVKMVYGNETIAFDLGIHYSLPALRDKRDEATKEMLAKMVFGFKDLNRYNEQLGALEQHIKQRSKEQVTIVLGECPADPNGLPTIDLDDVNWLNRIKFSDFVHLAELRLAPMNMHFPQRVKLN